MIAAAIWRWSGLGSSSPIHASNRSPRIYSASALRASPLKTQKTGGDRRFFHAEMKICNKECRHDYSLTVTLSMITSSFGTSGCIPLRPVCNTFDFVYHVHAVNHFQQTRSSPNLAGFRQRSSGKSLSTTLMKNSCSCQSAEPEYVPLPAYHGYFSGRCWLRFDRVLWWLLFHARFKTAALNHKAVDNTVENGVVVKPSRQ